MSVCSNELLELIKKMLRHYSSRVIPGLLELLNVYCTTRHGKDVYTIFVESPCKFYKTLLELYKTESSADVVFRALMKALLEEVQTIGILDTLLEYAKTCKDSEFVKYLETLYRERKLAGGAPVAK